MVSVNGHSTANGSTAAGASSAHPESVLASLDLSLEGSISGVVSDTRDPSFSGGSGEVVASYCPSTGKVLAKVATVSLDPFSRDISINALTMPTVRMADRLAHKMFPSS